MSGARAGIRRCRFEGHPAILSRRARIAATIASIRLPSWARAEGRKAGWLAGLEPATPRSPIWCSAMLSYSHHGAGQESSARSGTTILPAPIVREWIGDAYSGRVRPDVQDRRAHRVPPGDDTRVPPGAQAHADRLRRHGAHLRPRLLPLRQ